MFACRLPGLIAALALFAGCGSGSTTLSPTPTPTPTPSGPVTVTLSGTTMQSSATTCGGDSHSLTIGAGDASVQLIETSDPAGALSVQLCPGSNDSSTCTIKQQRISVGQTLSGTRAGAAAQTLKFLPFQCVFGSGFDPTPITYRVSVTYQQ